MSNPGFSKHTLVVEHVTIQSSNAFDIVRAKLEALLPRIDDGVFTLLRYGESARALRELEAGPTLSIFGLRDHGALLTIAGLRRRAIQYDIGNPLTASRMTRHEISAGLYAPVRVLLRENSDGVVVSNMTGPLPSSASSKTIKSTLSRNGSTRISNRHWKLLHPDKSRPEYRSRI
jgi:uncharacterized protein (DUF302 family)